MESECPFCGAGLIDTSKDNFPTVVYGCFSHANSSLRTKECYERQILSLQHQNQALRGLVGRMKKIITGTSKLSDVGSGPVWVQAQTLRHQASTLLADIDRLGEGEGK